MIAESPARFEPYRSNYKRHINGNAIYKLGDPCFNAFLDNVYAEYGYYAAACPPSRSLLPALARRLRAGCPGPH